MKKNNFQTKFTAFFARNRQISSYFEAYTYRRNHQKQERTTAAVIDAAVVRSCATIQEWLENHIDFTDVIKYSYLKKKGGIESVCEAKKACTNGRRSERNAGNE